MVNYAILFAVTHIQTMPEGGAVDRLPEGQERDASLRAEREANIARFRETLGREDCTSVAEVMGDAALAEQVRDVIARSNAEGHLLHGIHRDAYVDDVRREGIKTLTPEGGNPEGSSYWTSGRRIFGMGTGHAVSTFDTTFFHYGHSYDPSGRRTIMTIAATNPVFVRTVLQRHLPAEPDSYLALPFTLPRAAVHLFRVEIEHPAPTRDSTESRKRGQRAERLMLGLLDDALRTGYAPGEETCVRIREEGAD